MHRYCELSSCRFNTVKHIETNLSVIRRSGISTDSKLWKFSPKNPLSDALPNIQYINQSFSLVPHRASCGVLIMVCSHCPTHRPTKRQNCALVLILHRGRYLLRLPLGSVVIYQYLCLSWSPSLFCMCRSA